MTHILAKPFLLPPAFSNVQHHNAQAQWLLASSLMHCPQTALTGMSNSKPKLSLGTVSLQQAFKCSGLHKFPSRTVSHTSRKCYHLEVWLGGCHNCVMQRCVRTAWQRTQTARQVKRDICNYSY